jgi:tetratricopeptide (TPR) repeat protein
MLSSCFIVPWACVILCAQPVIENRAQTYSRALYDETVALVRAGNLEKALARLEDAIQREPGAPELHNLLGTVLTRMGRLKEADEAYDRALTLNPGFYAARRNKAINAFTRRDFDQANRQFRALIALDSKDFMPHLFLGLTAIEGRQFEQARDHLLEARKRSRSNVQTLLPLIKVYFILGEPQTAAALAREAQTNGVISAAERFELGVLLAQFGANPEAEAIFGALRHESRNSYDIGFNLALVKYRTGQFQEALQVIDQLPSNGSQTGEALNLKGWIFSKMGQLDKAQRSLELAVRKEPDNGDHYLDLSTVLRDAGQRDLALRTLAEGMDHVTQPERLQVQMGLLLQEIGNHEEAERWYRKALQANDRDGPAYLALAHLLLTSDRSSEGLELLARAQDYLPGDPMMPYMRAVYLLDSTEALGASQIELAGTLLKISLQLNPFYANTHYWLGKYFLRKSDLPSAAASFEKACALNPRHANAYYQRIRIAVQQGNRDKAAELSTKVRELHLEDQQREQEAFSGLIQESLRHKSALDLKATE